MYLYQAGGMENKEFEFYSNKDFTLAFADPEEFKRIMDQLLQDYSLTIRATNNLSNGRTLYRGVKLTSVGKEVVERGLPKMLLCGLVSQEYLLEILKLIN